MAGRYEEAELWYLRAFDDGRATAELAELDRLAQERSVIVRVITQPGDLAAAEEALRQRLSELEVISHRPFHPGARLPRR